MQVESNLKMDEEKPKRCNEDRNRLQPNKQAARHRHTDVTVINHVNIGSDHKLVKSNIKLDVEVERKQFMTKRPPRVYTTRIGSRKFEFQLELRHRFETLQVLNDIDTMSETTTDMIQQNASRIAKAINKPHKSRISLPTLMTKRREIAGNGDNKQRIEYAEIYKIIKKKTRDDIRKYNQEIIRETNMASNSLKKNPKNAEARPRQTDHTPGQLG